MSNELLIAALEHLACEIEVTEWNKNQETFDAPIGNNGSWYKTDKFVMRAFCWCDGSQEGHEHGCPPNFEWRDYKCRWYKYVGRGFECEPEMPPTDIAIMLDECLASTKNGVQL